MIARDFVVYRERKIGDHVVQMVQISRPVCSRERRHRAHLQRTQRALACGDFAPEPVDVLGWPAMSERHLLTNAQLGRVIGAIGVALEPV